MTRGITFTALRRGRVLTLAVMVAGGLMVSPLTTHRVGATLSTCADCPTVGPNITLSDGTRINTGVSVNDSLSDIQQVTYAVHVPAGLTVTSIAYQGSQQVSQSAQVYADEPLANTYDIDTRVTTATMGILVYPFTQVSKQSNGCVSGSTVGLSNQDLWLHLILPGIC